MASSSNGNDDAITGINVTPLVDITLVLLIIFMVTATYIAGGVDRGRPPARRVGGRVGRPHPPGSIDRTGSSTSTASPSAGLEPRPRRSARPRKSPEARALIGADKAVSHGVVVSLIDLVKTEGLTRFAIQIAHDGSEAAR